MRVLLIRHAEAEDRAPDAGKPQSDALRPLTQEGRRRFRQASEALKRIEPQIAVVASSPLVRAVETAALVAKQYNLKPVELEAMSPGGKHAAVFRWLQTQDD